MARLVAPPRGKGNLRHGDVTRARAAYESAKSQGGDSAEAEAELRRAQAQLLATGNDI